MSFLPPGVQSTSLAGFPQITYERQPIIEWQANTPFLQELCDFFPFDKRQGRTKQFYGQKPMVASTTKLSEGIPGPSLSLSQVLAQVFADEYGDWIGLSNIAVDMFINNIVVDATRNLGYRAALTGNLVASLAFDSAAAADATSRIDLQDNEFLLANTIRRAETSLVNNNVPGRASGMYTCVMSPLMSYDLFADNSAGSATDSLKRTESGVAQLKAGIVPSYQILEWAGVRIIRTTTVPTYANYPSAGKTGYGAFVVGKEAMLASDVIGYKAPLDKSYKVMVKYETEPSLANPMVQTAAIVSYDFFLGVVARPATNGTAGFRRIRGEVSVV